jgi:hypothetical protein
VSASSCVQTLSNRSYLKSSNCTVEFFPILTHDLGWIEQTTKDARSRVMGIVGSEVSIATCRSSFPVQCLSSAESFVFVKMPKSGGVLWLQDQMKM